MSRKIVQVSSQYEAKDGTKKWRNATVGSAWINDDGTVSVLLDPGISIASVAGVRINIRDPFDRDAPQQQQQRQAPKPAPTKQPGQDNDIPF